MSDASRRTHDRVGGQVYFPVSQDIRGHGSGGRSSRPAHCEWAALRVANGPGPLPGNNRGGAIATRGVLWPRVIPGAAPGWEQAAADRGRVCYRQRYGQPGVCRGNGRWPRRQSGPSVRLWWIPLWRTNLRCLSWPTRTGGRALASSYSPPLCASLGMSCWRSTRRRPPPSQKGCRIGWRSRMVFRPADRIISAESRHPQWPQRSRRWHRLPSGRKA